MIIHLLATLIAIVYGRPQLLDLSIEKAVKKDAFLHYLEIYQWQYLSLRAQDKPCRHRREGIN